MYGPGLVELAQYQAKYARYRFLMMPLLGFTKRVAAHFFGGRRRPAEITEIVLHDTESQLPFDGAVRYLAKPSDGEAKSIHYLIGREFGQIVAMVPEEREAYHALSHNHRSIGIEMYKLKSDKGDFTDWQYQVVSQLVYDLMLRYRIPRKNVVSHASIQSWDKTDPRGFNWARFDTLLRQTADFARFFDPRFKLDI
jgi:N-acetyl-anhydromuramyl-L-alanine amidase AmpD